MFKSSLFTINAMMLVKDKNTNEYVCRKINGIDTLQGVYLSYREKNKDLENPDFKVPISECITKGLIFVYKEAEYYHGDIVIATMNGINNEMELLLIDGHIVGRNIETDVDIVLDDLINSDKLDLLITWKHRIKTGEIVKYTFDK